MFTSIQNQPKNTDDTTTVTSYQKKISELQTDKQSLELQLKIERNNVALNSANFESALQHERSLVSNLRKELESVYLVDHSNMCHVGMPVSEFLADDGFHLNEKGTSQLAANIKRMIHAALNIPFPYIERSDRSSPQTTNRRGDDKDVIVQFIRYQRRGDDTDVIVHSIIYQRREVDKDVIVQSISYQRRGDDMDVIIQSISYQRSGDDMDVIVSSIISQRRWDDKDVIVQSISYHRRGDNMYVIVQSISYQKSCDDFDVIVQSIRYQRRWNEKDVIVQSISYLRSGDNMDVIVQSISYQRR
ncbi:unnamed protein product [Mytilus coruscus]|uniref:Uncharacterized protein n=1 Tax=Mytilus coruscus TaxID=42192 RepID=A0A6J8D678_MYTCO|nr:unnamed protein product [Mytilus coruscus]